MKKLIRSYSFWTALAGGLGVLASAIARAFSVKLEEKIITDIVMSLAGVLVAIGFVKMPQTKDENPEAKAQNDKQNMAQNDNQAEKLNSNPTEQSNDSKKEEG